MKLLFVLIVLIIATVLVLFDDFKTSVTESYETPCTGDHCHIIPETPTEDLYPAKETTEVPTKEASITISKSDDSKVSSSLGYAYIDESCKRIPIMNPDEMLCNQKVQVPTKEFPKLSETRKKRECKKVKSEPKLPEPESEMYDTSELQPQSDIDSPYGFVYLPNKYWKDWEQQGRSFSPGTCCKVHPSYTHGVPKDALDYTQVGSILPKFQYTEYTDSTDSCEESA